MYYVIKTLDGGWANTDASKSFILLSDAGVVVDRCCTTTFYVQDCVRDPVTEKEFLCCCSLLLVAVATHVVKSLEIQFQGSHGK